MKSLIASITLRKMKRYKINAVYKADVELVVAVEDDKDPHDPANWEIESEQQTDFRLYDSETPEEIEEE